MHRVAVGPSTAALVLCALAAVPAPARPQAIAPGAPNSFTVSGLAGLHEPVVEALLHNPPASEVTWRPLNEPARARKLEPSLVLRGKGLPDGAGRLTWRIEGGEKLLQAST